MTCRINVTTLLIWTINNGFHRSIFKFDQCNWKRKVVTHFLVQTNMNEGGMI